MVWKILTISGKVREKISGENFSLYLSCFSKDFTNLKVKGITVGTKIFSGCLEANRIEDDLFIVQQGKYFCYCPVEGKFFQYFSFQISGRQKEKRPRRSPVPFKEGEGKLHANMMNVYFWVLEVSLKWRDKEPW